LGLSQDGSPINFQALTAIHFAHRALALVTLLVLGCLAWHLSTYRTLRAPARALAGLLMVQAVTGVSNVVLGWPLVSAVLHTGGAGAMVVVLVGLLAALRFQNPGDGAGVLARRPTE
jgi:cytochrome c oxidase assembly protein subunit 15